MAVQALEHRIGLDPRDARVVLLVRAIQPVERGPGFFPEGMCLGDVVGGASAVLLFVES